ncbi:MAG TPA: DUF2155 domain-containing protein [Vineibacter terrae]|nr:DUF2155 domain-containing protein [Vineibacter terrae]
MTSRVVISAFRCVLASLLLAGGLAPAVAQQPQPPQPQPQSPPPAPGSVLQMPPAPFKPLQPSPAAPAGERRGVMLQGLDKVTTRTSRFPVAIGDTLTFGTLRISVSECMVNVPEAPAEAAAFLTVVDNKPGQSAETLFSGWMFASSPGLSALDSSVYDVWVVACANVAQASAPPSSK